MKNSEFGRKSITMKLSKAQTELIATLQGGGKVHWIGGFNAKCFYEKDLNKRLTWGTIFKCEELGLIKREGGRGLITLTDKGRELIINQPQG